jgi:hypothetical protein
MSYQFSPANFDEKACKMAFGVAINELAKITGITPAAFTYDKNLQL